MTGVKYQKKVEVNLIMYAQRTLVWKNSLELKTVCDKLDKWLNTKL